MLYSLIILLLLILYDPGFTCHSDNFMNLVYITMDTLVSMVTGLYYIICNFTYVLYRTRRRVIHDVVMAVVLKICSIFILILFLKLRFSRSFQRKWCYIVPWPGLVAKW